MSDFFEKHMASTHSVVHSINQNHLDRYDSAHNGAMFQVCHIYWEVWFFWSFSDSNGVLFVNNSGKFYLLPFWG